MWIRVLWQFVRALTFQLHMAVRAVWEDAARCKVVVTADIFVPGRPSQRSIILCVRSTSIGGWLRDGN